MNILFQRGGSALRRHFERILKACKLREEKAKDIDERGGLNRITDTINIKHNHYFIRLLNSEAVSTIKSYND